MNRQAVIDIVGKIFTHYGYITRPSDICDLLSEKDSERLLIKIEHDPNINSIRFFSDIVKRYNGKGLLISDFFDEKTHTLAVDEGLTLWDRGELESQIGRAVLGGLEIETERKIPVKGEFEAVKIPLKAMETSKEEGKNIKVLIRSVPVNVGKTDALSIAEAKVGAAKSQTLKFIPLWYYSYSFNIQKKFKSKVVDLSGKGEGYVHALTGENSFKKYMEIQNSVFIPVQNYEVKQPAVQKKDAASKAVDAITREHAKEVRLNELIGDTIVFENKMIAPEPEEIRLKMELIHIPVWEIKGKQEMIEINGYDGYIMAVKLYNDAEMV